MSGTLEQFFINWKRFAIPYLADKTPSHQHVIGFSPIAWSAVLVSKPLIVSRFS
jgi:hypothetical protein|tara:strand:- start:2370 stop:2531 length:162 start_codon:yes stop_codon:yes gene_type:complete